MTQTKQPTEQSPAEKLLVWLRNANLVDEKALSLYGIERATLVIQEAIDEETEALRIEIDHPMPFEKLAKMEVQVQLSTQKQVIDKLVVLVERGFTCSGGHKGQKNFDACEVCSALASAKELEAKP